MKNKVLLLLLISGIFGVAVIIQYLIFNNKNIYGRVKIVSSPNAGVFIDNAPVGRTPFENKYKVGEYNIKLIPEGVNSKSATWQGKVKVYKNALSYVNRELGSSNNTSAGEVLTITKMEKTPENPNYGEIFVETDPSGAIIYLDNDEQTTSPFIIERVLKGDHEISAYLPGFLRRTQKINVSAGYRVNVSFKLALDSSQQKIKEASPEAEATPGASITPSTSPTPSSKPSVTGSVKKTVTIGETPTGFLRVREQPSTASAEVTEVKPGETYDYLDEQTGWYKIKVGDKEGWVSADYVTVQ